MTQEEVFKLREIFRQKYVSMERTAEEMWIHGSREQAWDELLKQLGIEKMSKLMHLCVPAEDGEVRIDDTNPSSSSIIRIPRETALKILVLGL